MIETDAADGEGDYFTSEQSGHGGVEGAAYERVMPKIYAEQNDDFMKSMINNYALEGKNEDGTPNGKFLMNTARAMKASSEVLESHKGLKGKDNEEYLKTYFQRTFNHFDVTHDGLIGVEMMPQFMRFLASDQAMALS